MTLGIYCRELSCSIPIARERKRERERERESVCGVCVKGWYIHVESMVTVQ